jgi:hypothetical protein
MKGGNQITGSTMVAMSMTVSVAVPMTVAMSVTMRMAAALSTGVVHAGALDTVPSHIAIGPSAVAIVVGPLTRHPIRDFLDTPPEGAARAVFPAHTALWRTSCYRSWCTIGHNAACRDAYTDAHMDTSVHTDISIGIGSTTIVAIGSVLGKEGRRAKGYQDQHQLFHIGLLY